MGSFAAETEADGLEIYLKLSKEKPGGVPRVLSLVSSCLERSVHKNEMLLESRQNKDDDITIFHGSSSPSLGIQQYMNRICKYSCCSPSCFVVAHIYVERFIQSTNARLTSLNVHRLLITSIMVAAKFMDDAFFNNAYYAKVGGVSTRELNRLEMKFLFALDFRLNVSVESFSVYCSELEKEGTSQIERPIKGVAVESSKANHQKHIQLVLAQT